MLALLGLGSTDPAGRTGDGAVGAGQAFFSASQDIVLDAWRVEILDERQYGAGAAAVVLGYRIGMLTCVRGRLSGKRLPWSMVYTIMAALVGVGLITMLEPRAGNPRLA